MCNGVDGLCLLRGEFGLPFRLDTQMPFSVKHPVNHNLPDLQAGERHLVMETPIFHSAKRIFQFFESQMHSEKLLHGVPGKVVTHVTL